MKVAFHSQTLSFRGSENAVWDYAQGNESVLGNRSVICYPASQERADHPTLLKWKARFPLIPYRTKGELARKLQDAGASVLYQIKPGPFDAFLVPGLRNCIHAMFLTDEYHGDCFAYVSAWAAKAMTGREESYVPHQVPKLESPENLREKLGIPVNARVFGRHGGWDTFNIPFVRKVVAEHARRHPEDHFLFLNTEPIRGTEKMKNVHYLPATVDAGQKAAFLATCDAMLHARWHGETFGLAVGEFAVLGKPVITYGGSRERAHLEMLGEKALIYKSKEELLKLLREFRRREIVGTEYAEYADPKIVMEIFQKNFLQG